MLSGPWSEDLATNGARKRSKRLRLVASKVPEKSGVPLSHGLGSRTGGPGLWVFLMYNPHAPSDVYIRKPERCPLLPRAL